MTAEKIQKLLPNPDMVSSAEYREIHELIMSQISADNEDSPPLDTAIAIAESFIEHALNVLDCLRDDPKPTQ